MLIAVFGKGACLTGHYLLAYLLEVVKIGKSLFELSILFFGDFGLLEIFLWFIRYQFSRSLFNALTL